MAGEGAPRVAPDLEVGAPARGSGAGWSKRIAVELGQALVVAFAVVTVSFLLVRLVPGDPARAVLGPRASPEAVAALRHEMHIDHPTTVEYVRYLDGLVHGNLG